MGTAVTTVQRPPEKPVQRSAHSSAVGHGLGLGGNGALWAFGTYGWGWAAAIGGLTAAGMGIKHLRNKRRGSRGGGLFGGRSGGSRGGLLGGLGRKRSGGGLGLGGGGRKGGGLGTRGGRAGGSGKGAGGFLSKLAGKRSSTPKGGGGVPGRGSKKGGLLGRKGGGLLGGKGAGTKAGGSRRGGGLLGGGKGGGRKGGGSGGSGGGGKGKRGLLSQLNPFRNRGGGSGGGGKGKGGGKDKGKGKNKGKNKDRNPDNASPPSGWEEAPLNPNHIKWEDITMADPTATPRRRVAAPGGGGGRAGGGGITQAAEQLAGVLARPPREVNLLKNFDEDLGDLAGALTAVQGGMKSHAAVVAAGMPAERAAHEELERITRVLGQAAESLKSLQGEQRRRNALDHERVDNGRPNEQGYDHKTNNNR